MKAYSRSQKVGISLLLAAFLTSACALHNQPVPPQLSSGRTPLVIALASPPPVTTHISPEDAITRAVNTLTPTDEGYQLHHPHYTATFAADGVTFQPKREEVRWQWHLIEVGTTAGPLAGVKAGEVRPEQAAAQTVVYRRGVLDEQYVARKGSIEQQFVIPQPLALAGADLRIRGQVQSGGRLESRDERWMWRGEDQGIWLGQVYVYDAQGTTLPSRLEVSQGEATIVIEGQALAQAVYPVVVDPEIGVNDFRISDMGPDGKTTYNAYDPAVAYNPTNNEYLVVWWGDDGTGKLVDDEYEIYGQQIDGATGAEIGVNDFRISDMGPDGDPDFFAYYPAVAYNSTNNEYLVVWSGNDKTGKLANGEIEIFGQRLAGATGAEVGPNDFRISDMGPDGDPTFDAFGPTIAYNSTNNEYLVAWFGNDGTGKLAELEYEIYGQRLAGATGAEVGVNDFRISNLGPDGDQKFDVDWPAVAYNSANNEYLVVWSGGSLIDVDGVGFEIFGQRLAGATGAEIGANDFLISEVGFLAPAVAYNSINNEYLVVSEGYDDSSAGEQVLGQRLAGASGTKVGVYDFPISSDLGADRWQKVTYNRANNEYLVVWSGKDGTNAGAEIYGQRLAGATGVEVGADDFRLSDMGPDGDPNFEARFPAVVHNNTNNEYLVVWSGDDNTGTLVDDEFEIYGQRWSTCGDGVVDSGEECDPGESIGIGGIGSCTASCTINLCGNGVVDADEDCDLGLGNGLPGSQCTFTCQHPSILNLERLHDLVASCEICPPEVKTPLLDLLARAQTQLAKGNLKGALNILQQFEKKTQQFLRKGQLPDAEGRLLQLQAEVIIAQLQEQLAGH